MSFCFLQNPLGACWVAGCAALCTFQWSGSYSILIKKVLANQNTRTCLQTTTQRHKEQLTQVITIKIEQISLWFNVHPAASIHIKNINWKFEWFWSWSGIFLKAYQKLKREFQNINKSTRLIMSKRRTFIWNHFKAIVRWKLRWVKSGVNLWVMGR